MPFIPPPPNIPPMQPGESLEQWQEQHRAVYEMYRRELKAWQAHHERMIVNGYGYAFVALAALVMGLLFFYR